MPEVFSIDDVDAFSVSDVFMSACQKLSHEQYSCYSTTVACDPFIFITIVLSRMSELQIPETLLFDILQLLVLSNHCRWPLMEFWKICCQLLLISQNICIAALEVYLLMLLSLPKSCGINDKLLMSCILYISFVPSFWYSNNESCNRSFKYRDSWSELFF